jgi:hypothetical protein
LPSSPTSRLLGLGPGSSAKAHGFQSQGTVEADRSKCAQWSELALNLNAGLPNPERYQVSQMPPLPSHYKKIEPPPALANESFPWWKGKRPPTVVHPTSCFPPRPDRYDCGIILNAVLPRSRPKEELSTEAMDFNKAASSVVANALTELRRMSTIAYVQYFPVVVVSQLDFKATLSVEGVAQNGPAPKISVVQGPIPIPPGEGEGDLKVLERFSRSDVPWFQFWRVAEPMDDAEALRLAAPFRVAGLSPFERTLYMNTSVRFDDKMKNGPPTLQFHLLDWFDAVLIPAPHSEASVVDLEGRWRRALEKQLPTIEQICGPTVAQPIRDRIKLGIPIDDVFTVTLFMFRRSKEADSWIQLWRRLHALLEPGKDRWSDVGLPAQRWRCASNDWLVSLRESLRLTRVRFVAGPPLMCMDHRWSSTSGGKRDMCAVPRGPKRDRNVGTRCDAYQ